MKEFNESINQQFALQTAKIMFKVFASIWNPDLRVLSTHQIPVSIVNITLIRHVLNGVRDVT